MIVSDFVFEQYNSRIKWLCDGKPIEVEIKEIKDAAYYENENIILVLAGKDKLSRKLSAINPLGEILYILKPPENYCFYYLTTFGNGDNQEMAVACLDTTSARGFDIFFTIERKTNKLIEQGRKH